MNIIGLLLGILTAITILVSGCAPVGPLPTPVASAQLKSKSDQPKVQMSQSEIEGTWFGACVRDIEKDEYFREDTLVITADSFQDTIEYFSKPDCTEKAFLETFSGPYVLNREDLTVNYSKLSMTPEAAIIADTCNMEQGFCGEKDWKISEERSVEDISTCGYSPIYKTSIERFGSNELFLADRKLILSKKTTEQDQSTLQ